jgi:hypothetical protein
MRRFGRMSMGKRNVNGMAGLSFAIVSCSAGLSAEFHLALLHLVHFRAKRARYLSPVMPQVEKSQNKDH